VSIETSHKHLVQQTITTWPSKPRLVWHYTKLLIPSYAAIHIRKFAFRNSSQKSWLCQNVSNGLVWYIFSNMNFRWNACGHKILVIFNFLWHMKKTCTNHLKDYIMELWL